MLPIFLQSTEQQFDMQAACTHPKLTNVAADVLSHNLFFRFLQVVPEVDTHPTCIPKQLGIY